MSVRVKPPATSASVETKTCPPTATDHVVAVGRRDVHFTGGPGNRNLVRPRRPAVGALPEVLACCSRTRRRPCLDRPRRRPGRLPASGAGNGGEIAAVGISVVRRPEDLRVAPAVGLRRVLPVVRDVEAVAADAHLPGRGDGARRRDDAVVLERAECDARRRVRLDVEVVEQSGLEALHVERSEVDAAGAT